MFYPLPNHIKMRDGQLAIFFTYQQIGNGFKYKLNHIFLKTSKKDLNINSEEKNDLDKQCRP